MYSLHMLSNKQIIFRLLTSNWMMEHEEYSKGCEILSSMIKRSTNDDNIHVYQIFVTYLSCLSGIVTINANSRSKIFRKVIHRSQFRHLSNNIRKYNSTFYVGMSRVQNGRLYLRCGSSFVIITAEWEKHLQTKTLCYSSVNSSPRVLLPNKKAEKWKFQFCYPSFFLSSSLCITQKP